MSLEIVSEIVFAIGAGVALITGERAAAIIGGVAGIVFGVILLVNNF